MIINSKQKSFFIYIFLILIISACVDKQYSEQLLIDADQLMESNPDSALKLLNNIDTVADLREDSQKALFYLLLTQAQYKCYLSTTADSMLNFCIEHYTKSADDEKLSRTYYYMVMIAFERKQYEKSIPLLKKGQSLAEKLGDDELISKYYESMCNVNFEAHYWENALKYAKMFLRLSQKMNNNEYIARGYNAVALAFRRMEINDSADIYYKRVVPLLDKVGIYEKASLLTNIGCMYLHNNDLDSAKQYFKQSLGIEWRYNTAAALSEIYLREGNMTEAVKMRDEAMKTASLELKMKIQKVYADFLTKSGRDVEALDAYRQIMQLSDSLRYTDKKNTITELQLKYDKKEAEYKSKASEMKLYITLLLLLVGVMLTILIIAFLIHHYKGKIMRFKGIIKQTKEYYVAALEETQAQMDMISDNIKELEKDRIKNEKNISELNKKLQEIRQESYMRFGRGYDIYKNLINGNPVNLKENAARTYLIDYYSIMKHKIFYQWNMEYGKLTTSLITFLILCDMKMDDNKIMNLLGVSENTIRSNRSKLKKSRRHDSGYGSEAG